ETATIFIVGFVNHIPKGALLLVSDSPMTPEGVKTSRSDKSVSEKYVRTHLEIGIDSLIELRDSGESVMHLRFEWDAPPAISRRGIGWPPPRGRSDLFDSAIELGQEPIRH